MWQRQYCVRMQAPCFGFGNFGWVALFSLWMCVVCVVCMSRRLLQRHAELRATARKLTGPAEPMLIDELDAKDYKAVQKQVNAERTTFLFRRDSKKVSTHVTRSSVL